MHLYPSYPLWHYTMTEKEIIGEKNVPDEYNNPEVRERRCLDSESSKAIMNS